MARHAPYHFAVHFLEGATGRVWVNDLPLQKVPVRGPDSTTGGVSELLVPGKNRVGLEIWTLPHIPPPPPPEEGKPERKRALGSPVGFQIYQVKDPTADPITAEITVSVELPGALGRKLWERPELPFYHEIEFDLPSPVMEPPYWRSPPADFGCSGTPELVAVVRDLHDALMSRDVRRFLDLISLKHESFAAVYSGEPVAALDRLRAASERFFRMQYVVKPLDLSKVHFEPRAGGRVAMVSGWDDRPVLEAVAEGDPGPALRANLLLTQHDGRWRVFG
jgi:hypothetical protein